MWQVREEQARLRPDPSATVTGEVLNQMTYSRQVVKEVLRYRPPAPMVPQVRLQIFLGDLVILKMFKTFLSLHQ